MKVDYLGLLPKSLQSHLVQTITAQLQQWSKDWLPADQAEVMVLDSEFSQQMFAPRSLVFHIDQLIVRGPGVVCFFSEDDQPALAAQVLLCDPSHASDQPLVAFVSAKMQQQLQDRLALVGDAVGDNTEESSNASYIVNFEHHCKLVVRVGSMTLVLAFTGAYLHRFARLQIVNAQPQPTLPVASIRNMAAQQQIDVAVTLPCQSITVKQLVSLQVGHVIPLQQLIKAPLVIGTSTDQTRFNGFLVKKGDHKAIYMAGVKQ